MRRIFIPYSDADFERWRANFVTRVVATPIAYGFTALEVVDLTTYSDAWEVSFPAATAAQAAAKAANATKDGDRGTLETEIRALAKRIQSWKNITNAKRDELGITVPDTTPSPRPAITTIPIMGLRAIGGGEIEGTGRVTHDASRSSMHPNADVLEYRFALVPIGEMAPESWEKCTLTQSSKKAIFIINVGPAAIGKRFYGFFRWANQSNPANNGPWTEAISVVVA